MSKETSSGNFLQTTGGKIGVGILVVAAVAFLIFQIMHLGAGEESRTVPKAEVISEAQQQIDAINKMTNLTPDQKKAMIAHEQGEIGIAKGSVGSNPTQPGQPVAAGRGGN